MEYSLGAVEVWMEIGAVNKSKKKDITIAPLALPSIAGPGAIALGVVLTNRRPWYIVITLAMLDDVAALTNRQRLSPFSRLS